MDTHTEQIAEFTQTAISLTPDQVEGSQSLCTLLKGMCRKAADLLEKRFKYLGVVPWLLVTADTVEGAKACVLQINQHPLADHDAVTQDFVARLAPDLATRAQGGVCSKALADEVRAIENTPLDEACGEGYHRETNKETTRAPASTMAHLKRPTRVKGVIKDMRHFMKVHGHAGRNVVRFEFRNWQRIVQVNTRYKWRVRRMKAHLIFKRLYREDTKGDEDWSAVAQKVPVARTVPPEEASTRERLEREYLAATFQPLQYYSVEREEERQNEDGAVVRETVPHYFQLLAAQTSQTRDKTMHTVETADDITRNTGLLLHILCFLPVAPA